MTDPETREDDWARGVFDRVRTGQHEPRWTPDAAAAARLSGRQRTRFRAAGALAAAAVVGLSATAFTTLGGSIGKAGESTISPAAGQTTWNGLDLTRYLQIDGAWKSNRRGGSDSPLSATGLSTISTVLQRLDPGLKHIRTTSGPGRLDTGPDIPGTTNIQIQAHGFWAPKGDVSSFPLPGTSFVPTTPFGYVSISPMGPQFGQNAPAQNEPCGLGALVAIDLIPAPTTWSPCVRSPQPDGSEILVTHSVNLPTGTLTVAARVFPDHSLVQITASTVIGEKDKAAKFTAGPALNPVPWTDSSLAQALTGSEIKGLS